MHLLIFLPGIISLIRWKEMESTFRPFVFLIWIGCATEVIATYQISLGQTTVILHNIYFLLESFCILWFFNKTGLFKGQRTLLVVIVTAYASIFLVESLALKKFSMLNTYYIVLYSFITVLMSISTINYLLVNTKTNLLTNGVFIICIGFIVYFTQSALINSFWIYGLTQSRSFLKSIYQVMVFVNLFANITYAVGLLWIPKKQPSLLPS